jgi:hypothetical protein
LVIGGKKKEKKMKYVINRLTPSGIKQYATGSVYADMVFLAETAAKAEQPYCGWQVCKIERGIEKVMVTFKAQGTARNGKLQTVK